MITNLTNREKILWVNLLTTLVLLGYYFISILLGGISAKEAIWLYLKVVFWIIVIEIVVISILASLGPPEKPDERDRAVQARAYKVGYAVAMAGLGIAIWQVSVYALTQRLEELPEGGEKLLNLIGALSVSATPYITINLILLTLAFAEIAKAGTQLYYYRKGV